MQVMAFIGQQTLKCSNGTKLEHLPILQFDLRFLTFLGWKYRKIIYFLLIWAEPTFLIVIWRHRWSSVNCHLMNTFRISWAVFQHIQLLILEKACRRNRGYFMVGECGRFFFTSCERRERTSERSEWVSSATPRNEWRKIGQTNQPWSNLFILYVLRFQKNTTQKNRYEE